MRFHPSPFSYQQDMHGHRYSIRFHSNTDMVPIMPHQHDFCEAYVLTSSQMSYQIEDQAIDLRSGDILFVPPGRMHWPKLDTLPQGEVYERIIIWAEREFLSEMSARYAFDLFRPFDESWPNRQWVVRPSRSSRIKLLNHMEETLQETFSKLPGSEMLVQNDICRLLLHAARWMDEVHSDFDAEPENDNVHRINEICRYVYENCEKKLTLDQLAKQFYMNKFYLAHEFKKRIGMPLGRYINHMRLQMAQRMLQQGHPPTTLYIQCGFTEYSTFYRAFKAEFGMSPKEYAENQRHDAQRSV